MPIVASFGELDGLDAMVPWLGLTLLSSFLGVAGMVVSRRRKGHASLASGLGVAAILLELCGVARVLTDPWWRRRFGHGHGPGAFFWIISMLAMAVGLAALHRGRSPVEGEDEAKRKASGDEA